MPAIPWEAFEGFFMCIPMDKVENSTVPASFPHNMFLNGCRMHGRANRRLHLSSQYRVIM